MSSNKVIFKRSSVAGRIPTVESLDYGEVALNYADGRLYYKDSNNTIKFFEIGGNDSLSTVIDERQYIAAPTAGSETFDVYYQVGFVSVYVNGVRLYPEDFTATDGYTVTITDLSDGDDVQLTGFRAFQTKIATKYDRQTHVATAGQTTFSVSYGIAVEGAFVQVFVNGILLKENEYTATTGTSIVLTDAAELDDVVECIGYKDFSILDIGVEGNGLEYDPDTGTFTVLSSSNNEANTLVLRDAYGNFAANNIVANDLTINNGTIATSGSTALSITVDSGTLEFDGSSLSFPNGLKISDSASGLPGNFGFIGDETTDVLYLQAYSGINISFVDGVSEPTGYGFESTGITFPDQTVQTTAYNTATARGILSASDGITYNSSTGQFSLTDTGVTAGEYGSASLVPVITVNANGQITSASTVSVAGVSDFSFDSNTHTYTIDTADGGSYSATGDLVAFNTDDLTEGSNLYYTTARANSDFDTRLATKTTSDLTEGSNLYYTDARARASVSVTDIGGDGSLSYNSTTGVITYTGPSAAEVRAHFSGGTGVTITDGVIAIGQPVATTDDVTFDNVTVNSIQINMSAGVTVASGQMAWNATEGTMNLGLNNGSVLQVGQESHVYAKATEAIANGQLVMFAGAQGDHLLVSKANLTTPGFDDTWIVGVATQSFTTNAYGYVTWFGKVNGINTSAWPEGTVLYADPSTPGGMTPTRPPAPNHAIQIAAVLRQHAVEGVLLVRPSFGNHMNELHDVYYTTPNGGDILKWNASNSRWEVYAGTTDNITEGSTNLYYTDARVQTKLGSVSGHIIPDTNIAYDLGSATNRFRDLYLSGNSIFLDGVTLSNDAGTFAVTDANSDPVAVSLSANTTDDLAEGSTNLYYTDTRVGSYLTTNSYATQSYVSTAIANLVDSAPSTLDTLNELAAALGDDPNFATTVSASIGTKAASSITISAGTEMSGGGDLTSNRTINHADVSRSDTTSSASPARNGSFTVVDSVTTNARGHVTAVNVKTVTLPDFEISTVTDSITLTTSWQDTSINGSDLSSGSYIISVNVDDYSVGGQQYNETYTGMMTWYAGGTNSAAADEIILHRAGHAPNGGAIYLRTLRNYSGELKLQIAGSTNNSGASNYIFKFRRMI